MTMDDNSSVYVGGLAFDSTEDMLRNVFEAYGDILAIKIIYDKESGQSRGFGFVTFTNPRAAVDAIHEMDGGLIGGRIVRVNEVKKLTARSMSNNTIREPPFHRDRERERDRDLLDKDKDKGCNKGLNPRVSSPQTMSPTLQKHSRARSPLPQHTIKRSPKRGRSTSNYSSPIKRSPIKRSRSPYSTSSPQSSERVPKLETTIDGSAKAPKRPTKHKQAPLDKAREELDQVIKCRQDLERKVAKLECATENKDQTLHQLQAKTKKFEGRLEDMRAAISQRKKQMRKLRNGVLQLQNLNDNLKASEKEFKVIMQQILATTFNTELESEEAGQIVSHDIDTHENSDFGTLQGSTRQNANIPKNCEIEISLVDAKQS